MFPSPVRTPEPSAPLHNGPKTREENSRPATSLTITTPDGVTGLELMEMGDDHSPDPGNLFDDLLEIERWMRSVGGW